MQMSEESKANLAMSSYGISLLADRWKGNEAAGLGRRLHEMLLVPYAVVSVSGPLLSS